MLKFTCTGFGYVFNSLNDHIIEQNELARAFGVIFSTARKFRVVTILQVWFPILRKFVRTLQVWGSRSHLVLKSLDILQRRNSATEDAATATMHRIGSELIDERLKHIMASSPRKSTSHIETDGRDLLSVLREARSPILHLVVPNKVICCNAVRSSLAAIPTQQLSTQEILCQISTFLAAGAKHNSTLPS